MTIDLDALERLAAPNREERRGFGETLDIYPETVAALVRAVRAVLAVDAEPMPEFGKPGFAVRNNLRRSLTPFREPPA